MKINHKYIKINSSKEPLHNLNKSFTLDEVKDEDNLAVLIEDPYVVIDFDNQEEFDIVCKIVKDKKIKTRIMKSTRGGHLWFKSKKPLVNKINSNTPLTLNIDIKSWGKKSLATVKKDGIWREWIQEEETVDELPIWLTPIKIKKSLLHLKDGDGRDPELFSFIIPLMKLGLRKEEIYETFNIVNKYIFDDPLSQQEIDKMFDDNEIFDNKLQFFENKRFLHNVFVDWLKSSYMFKSYSNQVYLYHNNKYVDNKDEVYRRMIEQIPELTQNQLREAYENLRLKATHDNDELDTNVINLKNGLFDLRDFTLKPHSPYSFTINQFNCSYFEDAYDPIVDRTLKSLARNDSQVYNLFLEMLGYLLMDGVQLQKSFILFGYGRNGKSTFLDMIQHWVGLENSSSLAIEDLNEKFRTAELVGKVLNIGDDSGQELLKNTAVFKKLVTGDRITVERKNQQPFSFRNTAKLLFAVNNLPPTSDKSEGFFRRCVIIPFNARFTEDDVDYDPNLIDKLKTENARNYLFSLAVIGLKRLLKNNKFTEPRVVRLALESYESTNNNVLKWIQDENIEYDNNIQKLYASYCLYCQNNNFKPMTSSRFDIEFRRQQKDT